MSQNTSNHPSGTGDPIGSNPYGKRYQEAEAAAPDLDAGAPQLPSAQSRRMNRHALLALGVTSLFVAVLVMWGIHTVESRKTTQPQPREETVTVAQAPANLPAPPSANQPPPRTSPPIPLASRSPQVVSLGAPMPPPSAPSQPSLLERRMMSADAAAGLPGERNADAAPATPSEASAASGAQPLPHPDTLMLRGTYIRCVLESRIVTDIPGFTSCVVTEPVYSFNGKRLLLPKGSKVLGKYGTEPRTARVAVIWDRIVTPTGIDVNMASPGVDNLGGAGHPGHFNAHWGSRISSALLISLLSDAFKYEAAVHGPTQTTISNGVVTQSPFESNTAQTVQNLANQAVQQSANRPATVTINQGTLLNVYVAKDVDFSGVVARF